MHVRKCADVFMYYIYVLDIFLRVIAHLGKLTLHLASSVFGSVSFIFIEAFLLLVSPKQKMCICLLNTDIDCWIEAVIYMCNFSVLA